MGVAGFTGRLTASLADLPTLISFVPFFWGYWGLDDYLTHSQCCPYGPHWRWTNVLLDAVANQYKPLATHDDLYISAVMFSLWVVLAVLRSIRRLWLVCACWRKRTAACRSFGRREAGKVRIREIEDNGFKFTPKGEEFPRRTSRESPAASQKSGISIIHPTGEGLMLPRKSSA